MSGSRCGQNLGRSLRISLRHPHVQYLMERSELLLLILLRVQGAGHKYGQAHSTRYDEYLQAIPDGPTPTPTTSSCPSSFWASSLHRASCVFPWEPPWVHVPPMVVDHCVPCLLVVCSLGASFLCTRFAEEDVPRHT